MKADFIFEKFFSKKKYSTFLNQRKQEVEKNDE